LLVVGIQESARFNNAVVFVKVAVVLAFIAFGAAYVNIDNWDPFIPENKGEFGSFGWSGIMRASGVIFFAYIGFDAVSTVAQEARNPQRDMPIGILGLSIYLYGTLYSGYFGVDWDCSLPRTERSGTYCTRCRPGRCRTFVAETPH
jgi:amino acid transporter